MSDKNTDPQDDKLKKQIDEILRKQREELDAYKNESLKKITDAQQKPVDPNTARRHPLYRSF